MGGRYLRPGAQLGGKRELPHHCEIALHGVRAADKWMVLAGLTLQHDETGPGIRAAVDATLPVPSRPP